MRRRGFGKWDALLSDGERIKRGVKRAMQWPFFLYFFSPVLSPSVSFVLSCPLFSLFGLFEITRSDSLYEFGTVYVCRVVSWIECGSQEK